MTDTSESDTSEIDNEAMAKGQISKGNGAKRLAAPPQPYAQSVSDIGEPVHLDIESDGSWTTVRSKTSSLNREKIPKSPSNESWESESQQTGSEASYPYAIRNEMQEPTKKAHRKHHRPQILRRKRLTPGPPSRRKFRDGRQIFSSAEKEFKAREEHLRARIRAEILNEIRVEQNLESRGKLDQMSSEHGSQIELAKEHNEEAVQNHPKSDEEYNQWVLTRFGMGRQQLKNLIHSQGEGRVRVEEEAGKEEAQDRIIVEEEVTTEEEDSKEEAQDRGKYTNNEEPKVISARPKSEQKIESNEVPKETHDQAKQESQPENKMWTKIHRRYVALETLRAYQLPWMWDEVDKDYIIIKQSGVGDLLKDLFKHTKLIRGGKIVGNEGYQPAMCEETGVPLSFDMKIRSGLQNEKLESRWPLDVNLLHVRSVAISSSRISGYGKIDVYPTNGGGNEDTTQMTWMHMEREAKSFKEFESLTSKAPGLLKQDAVLVWRLFDKVREKLRTVRDGEYLEHCAVRCTGWDPSEADSASQEKSATFMCFPYFAIAPAKSHPRRGLLQTYYQQQTTQKQELEQVIRKTGRFPKNHITSVPQFWAVVLSSGLLVTCAPISFTQITSQSLNIFDHASSNFSQAPSIIRLTDHLQRVFFIPIDHCRSWFAFMEKVRNSCLSDIDLTGLECEIFTFSGDPVLPEDWQKVSSRQKSSILPLRVHLAMLKEPRALRLTLEYKHQGQIEDSIDEDDPRNFSRGGRRSALVKRVPTWIREKEGQLNSAPESKGPTSSDFRNRTRLLPPSSGIVHNFIDTRPKKDAQEIYFQLPTPSQNMALGSTGENQNKRQEKQGKLHSRYSGHHGAEDTANFDSQSHTQFNSGPSGEAKLQSGTGNTPPQTPAIGLNIPPVFTWAIGARKGPSEQQDGRPLEKGIRRSGTDIVHAEEESLNYVCSYVDKNLTDSSSDTKKLYTDMPSSSLMDVEQLVKKIFAMNIPDLAKQILPQPSEAKLITPWKRDLANIASTLLGLLEFFMPAAYQCDVGAKYLGGILELLKSVKEICDLEDRSDSEDRDITENEKQGNFQVVDISGPAEMDLRGTNFDLSSIDVPISDCIKCKEETIYFTRREATDHLIQEHFLDGVALEPNTNWVMDSQKKTALQIRQASERIMRELEESCWSLDEMVSEIRYGVAENGEFNRDMYPIPKSLVSAFENLLLMLACSAKSTRDARLIAQVYDGPDPLATLFDRKDLQLQVEYSDKAENALENAKREIILMTFTDDSSSIGTYQAASPEFILATILDDLRTRDSMNKEVSLTQLYQQYLLNLEARVSQNPGHRLLSDIRLATQELDIIKTFSAKQRLICANLNSLFSPSSLRVTTASREAAFKFEKEKMQKLIDRFYKTTVDLDRLLEKAESLAKQTQSAVAVRQEDHGKAILVFTVVTVIFLPLSFITSYLGMNTVDIRDIESSQALFWKASLPLTVGIIVISLVIGLKGYEIKEFFQSREWWKFEFPVWCIFWNYQSRKLVGREGKLFEDV